MLYEDFDVCSPGHSLWSHRPSCFYHWRHRRLERWGNPSNSQRAETAFKYTQAQPQTCTLPASLIPPLEKLSSSQRICFLINPLTFLKKRMNRSSEGKSQNANHEITWEESITVVLSPLGWPLNMSRREGVLPRLSDVENPVQCGWHHSLGKGPDHC